jgi:choline dehydrogenase
MTVSVPGSSRESFDYVIIGAGSAGCVLAHRLSEDPSVRVLLIEAGPEDTMDAIRVPAIFSSLFGSEVDWDYQIEQQTHYRGSTTYPRGKTLGGSSSINLMVYIRGHRTDFDSWSDAGCAGWDYKNVLPYFTKAESNSRFTQPLHSTTGPLHVEDRLFTHELSRHWIGAATSWGLPRTDDFNGSSQIGAGSYQVTCHNGWRCSTADAYLRPAIHRPNLTVWVNTQVTRILFDGTRATGVSYLREGDSPGSVRAEAEVILSGGTINSPQLLLLSGIGPATQLRDHGINVNVDLPGVGENLHDHTMTPLVWAMRGSKDLLEMATEENMALWAQKCGGPFTSNGSEVGGFFSTDGGDRPDIQFLGGPTAFVDHGRYTPHALGNFTLMIAPTYPASRGRLWLRSDDPLKPPHIDPGYFTDPADVDTVKAGLRVALEIATRQPFAKYVRKLSLPDGDTRDDAALAEHAKAWSQTQYHPVGTCAMGAGNGAVVDPELKVRGTDNLRVVDASVMPTIVSGNINAATIMIAEKGADLIKTGACKSNPKPET